MRFSVRRAGEVIGYSDLETYEPVNGARVGVFRPTAAFEPLRPVFRRFVEVADARDDQEGWDRDAEGWHHDVGSLAREQADAINALELTLWEEAGELVPTGSIFISDLTSDVASDLATADTVDALLLAVIPLDPDALPPPREVIELPE